MACLWEQVKRYGFFYFISVFYQESYIPDLRLRVAGDIDDLFRREFRCGAQERRTAARARWVHEQHVRRLSVPDHRGHEVARVGTVKPRVAHTVAFAVGDRICRRFCSVISDNLKRNPRSSPAQYAAHTCLSPYAVHYSSKCSVYPFSVLC